MSTNTCSQRTREKYLRSREREERQREQNKRTGERKRKEEKTWVYWRRRVEWTCWSKSMKSGGGWRINSSPVTEPPQSCHQSQHPPLTVCWDELWSAGWPWLGHFCKNKYTIFFSIVLISYIYTYFGSGGLMSAIMCVWCKESRLVLAQCLVSCGHVGACNWLLNLVTRFITQWF